MPIDRQLLKRILEHYKHRIDEFLQDEKVKPIASTHLTKHIAALRQEIDTAMSGLASLKTDLDSETKNWIRDHKNVLKPAVAQYQKDAKQFLDEAEQKLSRPNLRELEIELARIAAEIAALLNL
jgi:hypothetical protein